MRQAIAVAVGKLYRRPLRRWVQFKLRTLILFMFLVGIGLGVAIWVNRLVAEAKRQRQLIAQLEEAGARVVMAGESEEANQIGQFVSLSQEQHPAEFKTWADMCDVWYLDRVRAIRFGPPRDYRGCGNGAPPRLTLINDDHVAMVAECSNVRTLDFSRCNISDTTPLKGMSRLKTLSLRGTKVEDGSTLATLNSLERVDLRYTKVTDVSPLAVLPKLKEVWLDQNSVTDPSPLFDVYDRVVVHWQGWHNYSGNLEELERFKVQLEKIIDVPAFHKRLLGDKAEADARGDELETLRAQSGEIQREIKRLQAMQIAETDSKHRAEREATLNERRNELREVESQWEQLANELAKPAVRLQTMERFVSKLQGLRRLIQTLQEHHAGESDERRRQL